MAASDQYVDVCAAAITISRSAEEKKTVRCAV
jgi:hypothetical protein